MSQEFKPGNIVFVHGTGPISKIIEWFSGRLSHCCMIVSDSGSILESQYLTNTIIRNFHYKNYEIIDLGLTDEQRKQIQLLALDFVSEHPNYGYKQLFWYPLKDWFHFKGRNPWNNPFKVDCSELVIDMLKEIGWFDNKEQVKYLQDKTPTQLYKILKNEMKNKSA